MKGPFTSCYQFIYFIIYESCYIHYESIQLLIFTPLYYILNKGEKKKRNSSSFLLTRTTKHIDWSTRPQTLEKIIYLLFTRFCSSLANEGLKSFLYEFCLSKNDFVLVKILFFATHIQLI